MTAEQTKDQADELAINYRAVLTAYGELSRAYVRLQADFKQQREALEDAKALIGNAVPGAFRNGVTDPTGSIDEGEVHASNMYHRIRRALNPIPESERVVPS
ncbi:MAG: hypothetical protein NUW01_04685 [Gemmatimonadaceae bacterium]|nr:hypothetical protein [Gemmatimonadaceae bacterium]